MHNTSQGKNTAMYQGKENTQLSVLLVIFSNMGETTAYLAEQAGQGYHC